MACLPADVLFSLGCGLQAFPRGTSSATLLFKVWSVPRPRVEEQVRQSLLPAEGTPAYRPDRQHTGMAVGRPCPWQM